MAPAQAQAFASTCATSAAASPSEPALANGQRQSCIELRAVSVYASPLVQTAVARLEALLAADSRVVAAHQQERAHKAAQEIAFGEIERIINDDEGNPFPYWFYKPEHVVGGVRVPGGKFAASNPDTVFRIVALDPLGRYELHGQFLPGSRPSYFSIHLKSDQSTPGNERDLGVLFDSDIVTDADGRFTVTLDAEPAGDRKNHLTLPPTSNGIITRDTLENLSTELPIKLTVQRLDSAAAQTRSDKELIQLAVARIGRAGKFVVAMRERDFYATPANVLPPVRQHMSGAWAQITAGNFALQKGEALVFTLDPGGARYLGVQTGDVLTGTLGPELRASTLNNRQAQPNADGTITYVLAPTDPGAGNWIDTGGVSQGIIMVRWQGLPKAAQTWTGVRGAKVVPFEELAPDLRASGANLAHSNGGDRRALYARRYSGW
jgi:hypothetical protein